jgi:hypothetical protein
MATKKSSSNSRAGAKKAPAKKASARKGAGRKTAAKTSASAVKTTRKTSAKKATGGRKTSSKRRYGPKASEKVGEEMHEFKVGKLRSGSGRKVTNPKQAIAIGLSEARRAGAKVPPPKRKAA